MPSDLHKTSLGPTYGPKRVENETLKMAPGALRGLPFSTYALRGDGWLKKLLIAAYNKTDRLREMRTREREGVKNP